MAFSGRSVLRAVRIPDASRNCPVCERKVLIMFENIGGKIKVFVIVFTVLEVIACILCGAAIIAFSLFKDAIMEPLAKIGLDGFVASISAGSEGPLGIVTGLIVMIAGSFAAWLFSFIPYGLGQLIQNTDKMVKGIDGVRVAVARNASPLNPAYHNVPYGYYPPAPAQPYPVNPAPVQPQPPVNNAPYSDSYGQPHPYNGPQPTPGAAFATPAGRPTAPNPDPNATVRVGYPARPASPMGQPYQPDMPVNNIPVNVPMNEPANNAAQEKIVTEEPVRNITPDEKIPSDPMQDNGAKNENATMEFSKSINPDSILKDLGMGESSEQIPADDNGDKTVSVASGANIKDSDPASAQGLNDTIKN